MKNSKTIMVLGSVLILATFMFNCESQLDELQPVAGSTLAADSTNELKATGAFYVATYGNDNNAGTIDKPFASWTKGIQACKPGQTVYIRGGSYTHSLVPDSNGYASIRIRGIHGTSANYIHVQNYPGETVIYNLTGLTVADRMKGVSIKSCSYVQFKGLNFTGATQQSNGYISVGVWAENVNYCIFEGCNFYRNQGSGMYLSGSSEGNVVLNCDFFENYDQRSPSAGGNADGLNICRIIERNGNERVNTVRGCRAWHNSDDGFDFVLNPGYVYVDKCWSFNNGYDQGNGNGFKLGENDGTPETGFQRILTNCLSFRNKKPGFSQNESWVRMSLDGCVAYQNGAWAGFYFGWHNTANRFTNCTSYNNAGSEVAIGSNSVQVNNSWNKSVKLTDASFVSLDASTVENPRQADGSLPVTNFLKLK